MQMAVILESIPYLKKKSEKFSLFFKFPYSARPVSLSIC